MNTNITITENAIKQIDYLINYNKEKNMFFRISVNGGGCAGFQYNFTFTNKKNDDDLTVTNKSFSVLIDQTSYNLIQGSTLDYVSELIGSSFKINNPMATSSCGCGTSFSL